MHSDRHHHEDDTVEVSSHAWRGEVVARVDRFLALFNEASRRFADLFPYNQLKEALLRRIGDDTIEIIVSSSRFGDLQVHCFVQDGALVRTDRRSRIAARWELAQEILDDALSRPAAYLCHPELFALGWFNARSRSAPPTTGLRD
jgi:hypothetical protein